MNYISIDNHMCICQEEMNIYHFGDDRVYVDGLFYVYGKKAGSESVEWMYNQILDTGCIPFEELRGAFSCVIERQNVITAFCDNSNMHCFYYSDRFLSSSFLKCVENEASSGSQLSFDLEAICEYLTLGNIYFDKTFFDSIHILNSEEVIEIKDGKIVVSNKPIGDIDEPSSVKSFEEYFDKLAYSLSEMRVCQALTGGYDSRLVYACLSKRINDHPAISAGKTINKEVKYAQKVAIANGDTLEIIGVEKPILSAELINRLFKLNDGIKPLDLETDIRLLCFKTELAKRFCIHVSGDGGAVHKDREWSQDFPFFMKKKSNSNQFYNQRLYYIHIDNHIGKRLKSVFDGQRQRFVKALDSIAKSMNTQSYDSWYYRISGNQRTDYNFNPIDGLVSYAPLYEIDIVRYSYALPRWRRFFCNSYRDTITKENKQIARVKTIYETNASIELAYVVADVFFQSFEYLKKGIRMIARSVFNKNIFNPSVLDWSLENEIRGLDITAKAVEYAKENGFIDSTLTMEMMSYSEIQKIIHIFHLYNFVFRL